MHLDILQQSLFKLYGLIGIRNWFNNTQFKSHKSKYLKQHGSSKILQNYNQSTIVKLSFSKSLMVLSLAKGSFYSRMCKTTCLASLSVSATKFVEYTKSLVLIFFCLLSCQLKVVNSGSQFWHIWGCTVSFTKINKTWHWPQLLAHSEGIINLIYLILSVVAWYFTVPSRATLTQGFMRVCQIVFPPEM